MAWLLQLSDPESFPLPISSFSPHLIPSHECFSPADTCFRQSISAGQQRQLASPVRRAWRPVLLWFVLVPHPQGHSSGPFPSAPLLVGWGPSASSPYNPLSLPSAPYPDRWLSNRATVLFPSLCKFKFCSLVLLTSSWPTS